MASLRRKPLMRWGVLTLLLHLLPCIHLQMALGQGTVVRLAVVNTPAESGLLTDILPDFEKQSGLRVDLYAGSDAIIRARTGQVDPLISHFGHADRDAF